MAKKNIMNLSKTEIQDRLMFMCVHRHNGLDHPQCYCKVRNIEDKQVILDIESSSLNADFGFIITYCLKPVGGSIIKRSVTPKEIRNGIFDKRLCETFIKDMEKYDRIIGHYSCRFDLPFIRTRCEFWGLPFPVYLEKFQSDTWVILKNKFKLHSNRLQAACEFFDIPAKDHPLKGTVWNKALSGDQKSINYILQHNVEDVISTEKVWLKINKYMKMTKSSI